MARIIEFQGRRIEVPDTATDAEVGQILSGSIDAPQDPNAGIVTTPDPDMAALAARRDATPKTGFQLDPNMPLGQHVARETAIAAQSALHGVGHAAGSVVDAPPALANLLVGGMNDIGGLFGRGPSPLPFSKQSPLGVDQPQVGNWINRNVIDPALGVFGSPPIPEDQMTGGEQTLSHVVDTGTGAVVGGKVLPQTKAMEIGREARPVSAVARDFGTGAGMGEAQDVAARQTDDPALQAIASLVGAIAGRDTGAITTALPRWIRNRYEAGNFRFMGLSGEDPNIPANEKTGKAYTKGEARLAAEAFQNPEVGAIDPVAAHTAIDKNVADLLGVGVSPDQMPTVGALAQDPGLASYEQNFRLKNRVPFIERDKAAKGATANLIEGLRDPSADTTAVGDQAAIERSRQLQPQEDAARRAQEAADSVQATRMQEAGGLAAQRGGQVAASQALDRPVVGGMAEAQGVKNTLFDQIDPNREVPVSLDPLAAVANDIRANHGELNSPDAMPNDLLARVDRMMPELDEHGQPVLDEQGNPTGGPGTISFGDLQSLRTDLASQIAQARAAKNYALADNLGRVRNVIGNMTDELAADGGTDAADRASAAVQNYRENFAPVYNAGPGDAMKNFREDYNLDRSGRSTTPPSQTASRFIGTGQPEDARSLARQIETLQGPDQNAARQGVRDFLMADLAEKAVGRDGTLNAANVDAWLRNRLPIIHEFPGLEGDFNQLANRARMGTDAARAAAADLQQASQRAGAARAAFDKSDMGDLAAGANPRRVAEGVLNDKWDSAARMGDITDVMSQAPEAQKAWRAATSDTLNRRVTTTTPAGQEGYEVSWNGLTKQFRDNEGALAKVYNPSDMNVLRQAHKILGLIKATSARATSGSDTAEKMFMTTGERILDGRIGQATELAFKHTMGNLEGGGAMRRLKLMVGLVGKDTNARDIIQQAWFNPEVAKYLLGKKVDNLAAIPTAYGLRTAIAADLQANRQQ